MERRRRQPALRPFEPLGFPDATAREATPKNSSPLQLADLDALLRCSSSIERAARSRRPKINFSSVVSVKRELSARAFHLRSRTIAGQDNFS
jgi:hypothetical protein